MILASVALALVVGAAFATSAPLQRAFNAMGASLERGRDELAALAEELCDPP